MISHDSKKALTIFAQPSIQKFLKNLKKYSMVLPVLKKLDNCCTFRFLFNQQLGGKLLVILSEPNFLIQNLDTNTFLIVSPIVLRPD